MSSVCCTGHLWHRISIAICAGLLAILSMVPQVVNAQPVPISRLPAGIVVPENSTSSMGSGPWNRLILLATAELSSGDLDRMSGLVQGYATLFHIVYLARVEAQPTGFTLAEVGIGFARKFEGRLVTVSSNSPEPASADLGFIQRQLLRANENAVERITIIAQNQQAQLIEAPTLMTGAEGHREVQVRFLININAKGELRTAVWRQSADSAQGVHDSRLVLLAPNLHELRRMHVDGREFTLGMPSPRAFALEGLPPGTVRELSIEEARLISGTAIELESALKLLD